MELHHLRYFVAVAHHLSFTKAADECRVAQPSLSQQVRRLENELHARLFDRYGPRVHLTDVGRVLLPRAEAILKAVEDSRAAVGEVMGVKRGRVVLGTLPMTGSRVLPQAVAAFRARYPEVQVILREESTAALTEMVMRGETDVTLTTLPVTHDELEVMEVLTEDILLAVPPGHRLAASPGPVELTAVAKEPFMVLKHGFGFRDLALSACRKAGFEPRIAYESAHIDTIQAMVAVGLGVALVPRMAAERDRDPAPVFLDVSRPVLTRTLALVWRRDRYISAAAAAFLDVARSLWAQPGATSESAWARRDQQAF